MARTFQIPIAFQYTFAHAPWRATSFSLGSQESDLRREWMSPSGGELQHTQTALSEQMPVRLEVEDELAQNENRSRLYTTPAPALAAFFEAIVELDQARKTLPESVTHLLIRAIGEPKRMRKGNAWEMRNEFMRLEESNAALLSFLRRWGSWGAEYTLEPRSTLLEIGKYGIRPPLSCLLPLLVWKTRREFRSGMLASPDAWLAENAALGAMSSRPAFPFLSVVATDCVSAIKATITLDHLRNVKSRLCARPDCDNIFELQSMHNKTYCSQYCAHLSSVRRNRAAKKQTRTTEKRSRR